jgi:hypothetical protein
VSEPRWKVDPDLVAAARTVLSSGGSLDEAAVAVLERTPSPIDAMKALMQAQPGLSLADAKPLVFHNLSRPQQEAAERLWDDIDPH